MVVSNAMRAVVLSGNPAFGPATVSDRINSLMTEAWEAGPRSAAELKKAATHWKRAAELTPSSGAEV